jgi:hypothetical protein
MSTSDPLNLKDPAIAVPGSGGRTSTYRSEREESPAEEAHRHRRETREHNFKIVLISVLLVGSALWAVLSSTEAEKKWAFGIIGSIATYAIRGGI